MSNGSKRPGPNPFRKPFGESRCQAHLLFYGGRKPCTKSRMSGLKVCEVHAIEMARQIGWKSPADVDKATRAAAAAESFELKDLRSRFDVLLAENSDLRQEVRDLRALPPRKRRQATGPIDGHVYFLHSDNLVKIGWASDLDARLKAYSPGARLLAVMPGTKQDESRMHKKFGDLKTNRREWFTYHPRVMEEVERIVREHGDPPRDLNEPMQTKRIVGPRLERPTQRRARSLGK